MKSIYRLLLAIPNKGLLLIPQAIYWFGVWSNQLVMVINNGLMPVLLPGGCPVGHERLDKFHSCMSHATHLKFLADWIDMKVFIMSPGDMLLDIGDTLIVPCILLWAILALVKLTNYAEK